MRTLFLLFISYLFSNVAISSAFANDVDPLLVKALQHATTDEVTQTINLEELRWLSRMSVQLEIDDRVPDPFYRIRILQTVKQEALNVGLNPQMVLAVMDIESNFNRYAVSRSGALGLMQIMPFWKEVLGEPEADLFNPLTNIRFGCEILRRYMDRYSNIEDALAGYNGSLGRKTYSDKILRRYNSRWVYNADEYLDENEINIAVSELTTPDN